MKKDEIVVNYYGLFLLYFCNYERKELQMNGAFLKGFGKAFAFWPLPIRSASSMAMPLNKVKPEPGTITISMVSKY